MRGILELKKAMKLNKFEVEAMKRTLTQVYGMIAGKDYEFWFEVKDYAKREVELRFKWKENLLLVMVKPWKILSKKIVKWN